MLAIPIYHCSEARSCVNWFWGLEGSNSATYVAKMPDASMVPSVCVLACIIQNPKLSVLITCLVEGAIQGVTNSGNVKSALGLAKTRLGYNM